jgi:hypothetical protein
LALIEQRRMKTLSLCIVSIVGSALLLCGGSLWARTVVSTFQRREGVLVLSGLSSQARFEFWSLSLPATITANLVAIIAFVSLFVLWRRRDFFSMGILSASFIALAGVWVFLFASLGVTVFDWFD